MYDISLLNKKEVLDRIFIDNAVKGIENQIRDSTFIYFDENAYFQELPQNLQYRLVKAVLSSQYKVFAYFFEDVSGKTKATEAFMF